MFAILCGMANQEETRVVRRDILKVNPLQKETFLEAIPIQIRESNDFRRLISPQIQATLCLLKFAIGSSIFKGRPTTLAIEKRELLFKK